MKPGGKLIMEVFSQKQLGNKTGGPQNMKLLYSLEYLKRDFETLSFLKIEEDAVFLSEGYGHNGRAETIRLVAQKDS
ncbi:MAG: hypothetical protein C0594_12760 [Marinilabiliales bacterium]|nr:MAG: hypothetical protein C0594_12760 [Marinilabiliales bacterium]